MHERDGGHSAWHVIAEHDDAAAVVDTLLELDPGATLTKTELSDAADVPLKSLYLDGTLDAIEGLGLLEKEEREGEEPRYSVATESDAFEAARAFDAAGETARPDSYGQL